MRSDTGFYVKSITDRKMNLRKIKFHVPSYLAIRSKRSILSKL